MSERHGWTTLNVTDWTAEGGAREYPAVTFHPAWAADWDLCACPTKACTRAAGSRTDALCNECRSDPRCR